MMMNKRWISIAILILAIVTLISSYYTTIEVSKMNRQANSLVMNKNYRAKEVEEFLSQSHNDCFNITSIHSDVYLFNDNILLVYSKDILTIFFILVIILSFLQLSHNIRKWNILMSQTKNRLFLVHYLQLKDGKKNALSLNYSF